MIIIIIIHTVLLLPSCKKEKKKILDVKTTFIILYGHFFIIYKLCLGNLSRSIRVAWTISYVLSFPDERVPDYDELEVLLAVLPPHHVHPVQLHPQAQSESIHVLIYLLKVIVLVIYKCWKVCITLYTVYCIYI